MNFSVKNQKKAKLLMLIVISQRKMLCAKIRVFKQYFAHFKIFEKLIFFIKIIENKFVL